MKRLQFLSMQGLRTSRVVFTAAALVGGACSLAASSVPAFYQTAPVTLNSGSHSNPGGADITAYSQVLETTADTPIVRVHFSSYDLGKRSYVKVTSLRDQQSQLLNASTMKLWYDTSALFNGNRVLVELHVAPGDSGVYVQADQVIKSCNCGDLAPGYAPQTLCGADNRVASSDNRIGRINGCTGWLISNGGVLAAGHCPGGGVFEVFVPASNPNGTVNASAVTDQYPVITPADVTQNNDVGDDYMIFRLNPDSLGRRAHDRLGFFRLTRTVPSTYSTLRVTGYGVDNTPAGTTGGENAQTRTDQTSTGSYYGQTTTSSTRVYHSYAVDTMGANSGSPIIWESNGFAIGIHTNGGCQDDGTGSNTGTSFNNVNLAAAINSLPGGSTYYLDWVTYPGSPADTGNLFTPDHNFAAAYNHAPSGGKVSIVAGSYGKGTSGNTGVFGSGHKAMTLVAPVGQVVIGN